MNGSGIDTAYAETFYDWLPEVSCLGCRHYRQIHGCRSRFGQVCHYLLDTGKPRGCPFGSGCIHRR
jgi:hypothetical protein